MNPEQRFRAINLESSNSFGPNKQHHGTEFGGALDIEELGRLIRGFTGILALNAIGQS